MTSLVRRHLTRIGAIMILGLSFASCVPASERIDQMLRTLPVPATASLVSRQDGVSQGSEDACTFPYTKMLYGTDDGFERISKFYTRSLEAASWQVRTDEFVSPGSFLWTKDKEFRLYLDPGPDLDFPEDVVANARSEHNTVYFLVINYADHLARTKCLGEAE